MTPPRIPLPLLHAGGRAQVTCEYKCGNACSHEPPNPSGNDYLGDIVSDVINRRAALKAGAVVAFTATGWPVSAPARRLSELRGHTPGLDFKRVEPNTLDAVVVPEGYEQGIVIRWGDPVLPDAPAWDITSRPGTRRPSSSATTATSPRSCRSTMPGSRRCW